MSIQDLISKILYSFLHGCVANYKASKLAEPLDRIQKP
jgi:hypothetical protein